MDSVNVAPMITTSLTKAVGTKASHTFLSPTWAAPLLSSYYVVLFAGLLVTASLWQFDYWISTCFLIGLTRSLSQSSSRIQAIIAYESVRVNAYVRGRTRYYGIMVVSMVYASFLICGCMMLPSLGSAKDEWTVVNLGRALSLALDSDDVLIYLWTCSPNRSSMALL